MELWDRVVYLGRAAQYDTCQGCGTQAHRLRDDIGRWIYPAVRPDGKRVKLLKILQSNACINDCAYCAQRSGRDTRRCTLSPDELARLFHQLVTRRRAEGLFLSSGVCGSVNKATERMLATVELVRWRYGFRGYVHLKILPGADQASIEQSVRWANRVSVNLETPNAHRLSQLSRAKRFEILLATLRSAHQARERLARRVSITTQFVVGAAGESDREILSTAAALYRQVQLARIYYSAFQPILDTPLENHSPTPAWREHRLYQADFLLRQYGFQFHELVFDSQGQLPRKADPKLIWAWEHPEYFPVEVNKASRRELLRVPGIGPISARRIIERRRQGHLRDLKDLGLAPSSARRAAPFVLLDGVRPSFQPSLPLFDLAA